MKNIFKICKEDNNIVHIKLFHSRNISTFVSGLCSISCAESLLSDDFLTLEQIDDSSITCQTCLKELKILRKKEFEGRTSF